MNCVPQNTTEAVQHEYNVGGLFVWAVGEDDKNSSQVRFIDKHKKSHFEKTLICYEGGIYQNDFLHQHVLQLDQGGLTLSSREQYLNKVLLNK